MNDRDRKILENLMKSHGLVYQNALTIPDSNGLNCLNLNHENPNEKIFEEASENDVLHVFI